MELEGLDKFIAPSEITEELEEKTGVITFAVADEIFGVEMIYLNEILRIEHLTPLYRVDSFIRGLLNLRGQIKPVIDLQEFLGIQARHGTRSASDASRQPHNAIVIASDNKDLVCLVDSIRQVEWFHTDSFSEVATIVDENLRQYVKNVIRTGEKPISVINAEHILDAPVWDKYKV